MVYVKIITSQSLDIFETVYSVPA